MQLPMRTGMRSADSLLLLLVGGSLAEFEQCCCGGHMSRGRRCSGGGEGEGDSDDYLL
jgi:hypothetical protein